MYEVPGLQHAIKTVIIIVGSAYAMHTMRQALF